MAAVLFKTSFYVLTTGSKIMVAILADRIKHFMNQGIYLVVPIIPGIALLIFSLILLYDGVKYLQALGKTVNSLIIMADKGKIVTI